LLPRSHPGRSVHRRGWRIRLPVVVRLTISVRMVPPTPEPHHQHRPDGEFAAMRQFERVNDRRASAMSSVKPVVRRRWMPRSKPGTVSRAV
jgi:hypothetical protein